MISDPIAVIIAALIALIGTLLGLSIGYRKWREDRRAERSKNYEAERQNIYKSLWDQVEALNAALRRNKIDDSRFIESVADLNEFMLRKSTYLDDSHQSLINKYILTVKEFHKIVTTSDGKAEVFYGMTMEIPAHALNQVAGLKDVHEKLSGLRDTIIAKIRPIIAGQ